MSKIELTNGPTTTAAIYAGYEKRAEDWRRDHLGASVIGHRCDRFLWLSFRWALNTQVDGQKLRLFERGKREERWVIRDLKREGITVVERDPVTHRQTQVQWGHVGGSLDAIVTGLPEAPMTAHVLEVKSSNKKQFDYLRDNGVKRAKRDHWVQMQTYMLGTGLERALYLCVCKDDDSIYCERVRLERADAQQAVDRARSIVAMNEPPDRMAEDVPPCVLVSKDGTRWPCKFFELCHGAARPERNCRTCCFSTPTHGLQGEPRWECGVDGKSVQLTPKKQRRGCHEQRTIPPIINAQLADTLNGAMGYQFPDGTTYVEGP